MSQISNETNNQTRVCFITAIYGCYEKTCKPFVAQTISADFVCFTDNPNLIANGWVIDTEPYHYTYPSSIDTGNFINSLCNNKHTFNIAKYYKQAFQNIPRLQNYETIIWLDGTIEITSPDVAKWAYCKMQTNKIATLDHHIRKGSLLQEVIASNMSRYNSTTYLGQLQPIQNVAAQYAAYLENGFDENYFKQKTPHLPNIGVWVTCFIVFRNDDPEITLFLNNWYLQTLMYTTQDQVGFPFVVQKMNIIPYTIPDDYVKLIDKNTLKTSFFHKYEHGL